MKLQSVVLSILKLVSFTTQAKEPLRDVQQLGKFLFQDKNLSLNRNQSCASCHSLQSAGGNDLASKVVPGFVDPDNVINGTAISKGNEIGKHKVMTLRNIALTPPYSHNGVLESLEQVVHFYNSRDILGTVRDNTDPRFGKSGWPQPEVLQNMNSNELGNLGLSPEEEKAIVAFLKTLTDDYQLWGLDSRVPPDSPPPF